MNKVKYLMTGSFPRRTLMSNQKRRIVRNEKSSYCPCSNGVINVLQRFELMTEESFRNDGIAKLCYYFLLANYLRLTVCIRLTDLIIKDTGFMPL